MFNDFYKGFLIGWHSLLPKPLRQLTCNLIFLVTGEPPDLITIPFNYIPSPRGKFIPFRPERFTRNKSMDISLLQQDTNRIIYAGEEVAAAQIILHLGCGEWIFR